MKYAEKVNEYEIPWSTSEKMSISNRIAEFIYIHFFILKRNDNIFQAREEEYFLYYLVTKNASL